MELRQATHYVIAGSGVDGTIDTSSVGGLPSVSIRIDDKPLVSPELQNNEVGMQVTGVVEQVPDRHSVHLRLFVPIVNVGTEAAPVAGLALLTTACTPFGPALVEGPMHSYEVRPVGGRADTVES
jgi:hypothetical protein